MLQFESAISRPRPLFMISVLALTRITCGSEQMAAESKHSPAQQYLELLIGQWFLAEKWRFLYV